MRNNNPTNHKEYRIKISMALKGRVFSEEHKEKISSAKKGKGASEKAKKNMSKAHRKSLPKTEKYKGVSWDKKRNKWKARIYYNKKEIHLGRFDTAEGAAEAYNTKASELFGPECYLNIIK